MTSAIELMGVDMGYVDKTVLKDVNISFEKGMIHCLFGRNGSGKTTLLKSIASFIPLQSGSISLGDRAVSEMSISERSRKMAIVLTERPHISNISVNEFISFGRYPYTNWIGMEEEAGKEVVDLIIRDFGLEELKERDLDSLSDGEMQKVLVGRALAQDVDILLLDEIASHLDLVNKAEMFNLLKNINQKSEKTVIFTSHDIQFALQLADYFTVIHKGETKQFTVEEFSRKEYYKEILESPYLNFDAEGNTLNYRHST